MQVSDLWSNSQIDNIALFALHSNKMTHISTKTVLKENIICFIYTGTYWAKTAI